MARSQSGFAAFFPFCLFAALVLSFFGCREEDKKTAPERQPVERASPDAETDRARIVIGGTVLALPAPKGFRQLEEEEDPLFHTGAGLGPDEALLRVFARVPPPDKPADSPENSDRIWATTLEKWLDVNVDELGFIAQKRSLEEASALCGPETLRRFLDSAAGWLAERPEYSYKLGMLDSGAYQISFASVIKNAKASPAAYVCRMSALIYRKGKVLAVHYLHNMGENPDNPAPYIADFLFYLYTLQTLDGNPPDQETPGRVPGRHPPGGE